MRKKNCSCGEISGKKFVLNSHAWIGMTADEKDGILTGKKGLYLENNYCPQCGAPYKVVKDGQQRLFPGEGIA